MSKAVAAWVLYDWAYTAFTTVVSTFVVATYFTQGVAADPVRGAAQWAGMQAAAGVAIALLAVPLGVLADRSGRRRAMLAGATTVLALATAALWFVHPRSAEGPGDVPLALGLVFIATIAFEIGIVFYNAMLPALASPGRLGRLSGLAWAAGYAGGLACLSIALVALVLPNPPPFGLSKAAAEPVRATAVLAGAWIAVFGWPLLIFAPSSGDRVAWRTAIRSGVVELGGVLRAAWADPILRSLLLARLLFMDGLTTLFAFGGIYAAGQFGLEAQGVLMFGIGLNVTGGLGAAAFAFAEDRIGAKATALAALIGLIVLGTALLFTDDRTVFWGLGLSLGLFVGPAQAATRSLMARLAPAEARAAFFGLFALSGRVTGFLGPAALAAATAAFESQRAGMAVIVLFLTAGAVLLARVPPLRGVHESASVEARPDQAREQQA